MEATKVVGALVLSLFLLLSAGWIGSMTVEPKVVETQRVVEVPRFVEVEKEVVREVEVEVVMPDPIVEAELARLVDRWEQVTDEPYDPSKIERELEWIAKAESLLRGSKKHQLLKSGYDLDQIRVEKYYNREVELETIEYVVDGKTIEWETPTVGLEAKVRYEDDEGNVEYERWAIVVEWFLDDDGRQVAQVTTSLA